MNTIPVFPARQAVLAQFEADIELAPFVRQRAPAMLEVLGRPVIHHWLDALCHAGVREVTIFASEFPQQIRQFVGRGERWGFERIEFVSTASLRNWQQVTDRMDQDSQAQSVFASLNSFPTEPLNRQAVSDDFWFGASDAKCYGRAPVFAIRNPADLWHLNMQMLDRQSSQHVEPGTFVDPAVRMEGRARVETRVVLDRQSRLTDSIIGKDTRVANGCELRNTVVFSNTALGSHLYAENMLIDGTVAWRLDTGCVLQIDDPAILGRLHQPNRKISLSEKLLASLLLFLTWPLVLLHRRHQEAIRITDGDAAHGGAADRELKVTSLVSRSRFTRRIPWLAAVIRGDLPLFGPRELGHTTDEQPGVISLADFGGQEDLDILVANRYQAHTGTIGTNLALAGKWLPRALMRS